MRPPPNELDTPTVSYHHVTIGPPPSSDITITTVIIWGIIPGTMYNVSVVALAIGDTIDL